MKKFIIPYPVFEDGVKWYSKIIVYLMLAIMMPTYLMIKEEREVVNDKLLEKKGKSCSELEFDNFVKCYEYFERFNTGNEREG